MWEHKDRHVVRRVFAPPALPAWIPLSGPAPEHLAAHDVSADAMGDLVGDLRVGPSPAARHPLLAAPAGGREDPLVKAKPALADRVFNALVGPGDKAVQRYRDLAGDYAHVSIPV